MRVKVSDYIVEFLISKGIKHAFGYPGGMITHVMNSFGKYKKNISAHCCYHEQGAAFAACGYAQTSEKPGVVYATSGPGVTNLITGIANAYFDSIPFLAIVGQVNTYEQKENLKVRQKGFQEMEVCEVVKPITKYSKMVVNAVDIPYELNKAYEIAMDGRKGPVVLDIPMNIQREEIEINGESIYFINQNQNLKLNNYSYEILKNELVKAKKPVIIAGNGIVLASQVNEFRKIIEKMNIPVVTSMIGVGCIPSNNLNFNGFIGAYGHRYANLIIEKADLILTIGSRLDCRQTGNDKKVFAKNARIVRVDIDKGELTNKIKEDEIQIICSIEDLLKNMNDDIFFREEYKISQEWISECKNIRESLGKLDKEVGNQIIDKISEYISDDVVITTDVGQNQVWVAQSFIRKENQSILFSGGHGAMGYSLPAAIGAFYGSEKKVISFNGDGGMQMNIQELQLISENQLPIKIIILNNKSLGMIRHFQEMYFDSNYEQTKKEKGYGQPDFVRVAQAYNIDALKINNIDELEKIKEFIDNNRPVLIEIDLPEDTYVYPKLAMGKPTYDQDPLIDRELLKRLLDL